MRSFAICAFWSLLVVNLSAQRYTTVRKYPLFAESSLHTFVFHFPTENDAYNDLPERSPWYLPMTSGWKYTVITDESNIPRYATWRYVDTLWKPMRARMAANIKTANQGTIIMRKVVPVPEEWYGLQVFVHFDYMSSPVVLWVNGIRIGNLATATWGCEWNVTPYLVFGRLNTILLQWDAAQVPMSEMGNAWLYAFPNVAIWDFYMTVSKNSKNKLVFEAAVLPKTFLPGIEDKYNLEFQLYNRRG
ncbi:MAG: sugar-binding domain-containing protein, partial [Bacteroidales bacterium]